MSMTKTKVHLESFSCFGPEHEKHKTKLIPRVPVRVHRVLPKDRTPRTTASHKQITDQYTNVWHVVKTLEKETVHGSSQIATWSNLLCKRKKVT